MLRFIRLLFYCVCLLVLGLATLWMAVGLWHHFPADAEHRNLAIGGIVCVGLVAALGLFTRRRKLGIGLFGLVLAGYSFWWMSLVPPDEFEFAPDVARQVTGEITDDVLTLENVRNFEWTGPHDAIPNWETRKYDLAQLETVDLFLSYWGGPLIAHVIVSFGFADGKQLAWSVVARREGDSQLSPLADLFKTNTRIAIAADERDVIGVRTGFRDEDVQLFRLRTDKAAARALLMQYVTEANALAQQPAFYTSLQSRVVARMIRSIKGSLPLDWRLLVNGYLPDYAYDHQMLDTRQTLQDLRALGRIDRRANAHGLNSGFSNAIRQSVPAPGAGD